MPTCNVPLALSDEEKINAGCSEKLTQKNSIQTVETDCSLKLHIQVLRAPVAHFSHSFFTPFPFAKHMDEAKTYCSLLSRGSTKNQIEKILILRVEIDIFVLCVRNWIFEVFRCSNYTKQFTTCFFSGLNIFFVFTS